MRDYCFQKSYYQDFDYFSFRTATPLPFQCLFLKIIAFLPHYSRMGDHESQSLERRRQALQRFQEKQASRATATATTTSTTTPTQVPSDPSKENINNPILTKEKGEGGPDIKNEVASGTLDASRRDSAARTMKALAYSRYFLLQYLK